MCFYSCERLRIDFGDIRSELSRTKNLDSFKIGGTPLAIYIDSSTLSILPTYYPINYKVSLCSSQDKYILEILEGLKCRN